MKACCYFSHLSVVKVELWLGLVFCKTCRKLSWSVNWFQLHAKLNQGCFHTLSVVNILFTIAYSYYVIHSLMPATLSWLVWLLFEYQKYKSVVTLISLFDFQMSFVPSLSPTRSMPSSSPPTSSYNVTRVSRGRSQTLRPVCLTAVLLLITTRRTVPLIRKMTESMQS